MLTRIQTAHILLALAGQVLCQHTSEAEESAIEDPAVECTVYGYQPVTDALTQFPDIWKKAFIVPNDKEAADKWASIQANIPQTAPKTLSATVSIDIAAKDYPKDDPDCWWSFQQCTQPKRAGIEPDIATMPEPETLGYGFDDGPNCGHNVFYNFLKAQNQTATMFYIGSNVLNWPYEAKRGITDGHEICVHTWSHGYMTSLTSEEAFAELWYTVSRTLLFSEIKAIKLVTGVTPKCWRPAYGDVDDRIRAIATALGLRNVLWKYDSNDWKFGSNPNITSDFVDNQYQHMIDDATNGNFKTAGAIILAHEANNYTMSEAMRFYPKLKEAFTNIVPVGVGYNFTQPYVEQNLTQPSFDEYVKAHSNNVKSNSTSTQQPDKQDSSSIALRLSDTSVYLLTLMSTVALVF